MNGNTIHLLVFFFVQVAINAEYQPFDKCEMVKQNEYQCDKGCVYAGISENLGCCGIGCWCDWCEPVGFGRSSTSNNHTGIPCAKGFYSDIDNAESCKQCEAGTYAPNIESYSCLSCPAGSYQDSPASSECIPCKPGTYNPHLGQNHSNACLPCTPGYNGTGATYFYLSENNTKMCLLDPDHVPTGYPTTVFSVRPSWQPSLYPTDEPSHTISDAPSKRPSDFPSENPSISPTKNPSLSHSTLPSTNPSITPTIHPSRIPSVKPSQLPSATPSNIPTLFPSRFPTSTPSIEPSTSPTQDPSSFPSNGPSKRPSLYPSLSPSFFPSDVPSENPTNIPSRRPSEFPSIEQSFSPSINPSHFPSMIPTELLKRDIFGNGLCKVGETGIGCEECCDQKNKFVELDNGLTILNPSCTDEFELNTRQWFSGGYYRLNSRCDKCPNNWLVIVVICLVIIVVISTIYLNNPDVYVYFHVILDFLQNVSLIGSLKIPWPKSILEIISVISYTNFDVPIDCFFKTTYDNKINFIYGCAIVKLIILVPTLVHQYFQTKKGRSDNYQTNSTNYNPCFLVTLGVIGFIIQLRVLMASAEAINCFDYNKKAHHDNTEILIKHWLCKTSKRENERFSTIGICIYACYSFLFPLFMLGTSLSRNRYIDQRMPSLDEEQSFDDCNKTEQLTWKPSFPTKSSNTCHRENTMPMVFFLKIRCWIYVLMLRKSMAVLVCILFRDNLFVQSITLICIYFLFGIINHFNKLPRRLFSLHSTRYGQQRFYYRQFLIDISQESSHGTQHHHRKIIARDPNELEANDNKEKICFKIKKLKSPSIMQLLMDLSLVMIVACGIFYHQCAVKMNEDNTGHYFIIYIAIQYTTKAAMSTGPLLLIIFLSGFITSNFSPLKDCSSSKRNISNNTNEVSLTKITNTGLKKKDQNKTQRVNQKSPFTSSKRNLIDISVSDYKVLQKSKENVRNAKKKSHFRQWNNKHITTARRKTCDRDKTLIRDIPTKTKKECQHQYNPNKVVRTEFKQDEFENISKLEIGPFYPRKQEKFKFHYFSTK